ncbi:MAG: hypothetical protein NW241_01480 [Bacteroidia bacterium]|nr:hypothetical protein [Bacteroidia bacterium]
MKFFRMSPAAAAALWLAAYAGCLFAIRQGGPGPVAGMSLALLPAAAFAWFLYCYIRNAASMDEVQVKVQMEAAVIAFSLGLLLLMILGLADLVLPLDPENWSYRHLVPVFAVLYFIGLFISRRRYQFDDEKPD